jgi:Na+-translocating ferredoxin:NAD+ oxidoreductase RNF subunit RnfB
LANKRLHVEEDPRIALILDELPGVNCGGCGYAGCSNFSDNLVKGNVAVSGCPVCGLDAVQEIAGILGVKAEAGKKLIARVLCQGGKFESARKAEYVGIQSCLAATLLNGGSKTCEYGCVGYGDCVNECTFDAMYLSENGLPVIIAERCTGCGKCAAPGKS